MHVLPRRDSLICAFVILCDSYEVQVNIVADVWLTVGP